jgi:hypothetical protein
VSNVVTSYFYCDASGEPLARIDRIEPGFDGAGKSFLPYLWNPSKGRYHEKPGLHGTKLPLYHLDEVRIAIAAEQTIFFVEGEGKCDRLRAALHASGSRAAVTTIAGGASASLREDHIAALAGAGAVQFLADSDAPGCGAATDRAQAVASAHAQCDVRIIDLYPTRDDGSDVSDWLGEGHTLAEIDALVEAAPRVGQSPMASEKATTSQLSSRATREQAKRPTFVRVSELLAQDDDLGVEYAVEGLLPLGGTAVLAGRPKGGKSTLALSLALAVARGEPFLGRGTRKGPVLYLALEGAPRGWTALLRKLGVTEGDDLLICIGRAPEAAIAWLSEEIEKHRPVLVILDTMQRLLRVKDGNDYATGSNATDAVIELARLANASLVMLHHSGKTQRAEIVDEVMGSTAWAAAVDTVLVLRRSERCRTLASEQRFGENLPETVLAMHPATCRISEAGTKADADRKATREAIVAFLRQHAEAEPELPFTDEPTIEAGVGGRTKAQREALREAVAAGEIERIGTGKKGDRYLYGLPRSLVPDYGEEQENENRKIVEKASKIEPDACSRPPGNTPNTETGITGAGNEHLAAQTADALFAYAARRIRRKDDAPTAQGELDL